MNRDTIRTFFEARPTGWLGHATLKISDLRDLRPAPARESGHDRDTFGICEPMRTAFKQRVREQNELIYAKN